MPTESPRAYTPEEVRAKLLGYTREIARYWANLPNKTPQERCDGLAFSILNIFDGIVDELPAMNITLSPHPDDQEYHRGNGENWYEPGQVVNDCMLHELYYKVKA